MPYLQNQIALIIIIGTLIRADRDPDCYSVFFWLGFVEFICHLFLVLERHSTITLWI